MELNKLEVAAELVVTTVLSEEEELSPNVAPEPKAGEAEDDEPNSDVPGVSVVFPVNPNDGADEAN